MSDVGNQSNPLAHHHIYIISSFSLASQKIHSPHRNSLHLHHRHQIHCHLLHHLLKILPLLTLGFHLCPHCQLFIDWLCSQTTRFCSRFLRQLGFQKNRLQPSFPRKKVPEGVPDFQLSFVSRSADSNLGNFSTWTNRHP